MIFPADRHQLGQLLASYESDVFFVTLNGVDYQCACGNAAFHLIGEPKIISCSMLQEGYRSAVLRCSACQKVTQAFGLYPEQFRLEMVI